MFTGLLMVCLAGTSDCMVDVSREFYTSLNECIDRSTYIMEEVNKNEEVSYIITDYHCVGWGADA